MAGSHFPVRCRDSCPCNPFPVPGFIGLYWPCPTLLGTGTELSIALPWARLLPQGARRLGRGRVPAPGGASGARRGPRREPPRDAALADRRGAGAVPAGRRPRRPTRSPSCVRPRCDAATRLVRGIPRRSRRSTTSASFSRSRAAWTRRRRCSRRRSRAAASRWATRVRAAGRHKPPCASPLASG
eukprot:5138-Prymnesium_polylepis.1